MLNQNLGIKPAQVVVMDRPGRWDSSRSMHNLYVERFREALLKNPAVEAVGMSDEIPGKEIRNPSNYTVSNAGDKSAIPIKSTAINEDYFHVL